VARDGCLVLVVDPDDAIARQGDGAFGDGTTLNEAALQLAQRAVDASALLVLPFALPAERERAELIRRVGADNVLEVCVKGAREPRPESNDQLVYELTTEPALEIHHTGQNAEACANQVVSLIESRGRIKART
jgi:hypothetical protein